MLAITKTIFPGPPYLIVTNIVILEVINNYEITRREAPEVANPRAVRIESIDFIDAPVVRGIPGKLAGIVRIVGTEE